MYTKHFGVYNSAYLGHGMILAIDLFIDEGWMGQVEGCASLLSWLSPLELIPS
jgi:hypothetical protein